MGSSRAMAPDEQFAREAMAAFNDVWLGGDAAAMRRRFRLGQTTRQRPPHLWGWPRAFDGAWRWKVYHGSEPASWG